MSYRIGAACGFEPNPEPVIVMVEPWVSSVMAGDCMPVMVGVAHTSELPTAKVAAAQNDRRVFFSVGVIFSLTVLAISESVWCLSVEF